VTVTNGTKYGKWLHFLNVKKKKLGSYFWAEVSELCSDFPKTPCFICPFNFA
jgi:hypothetical protein